MCRCSYYVGWMFCRYHGFLSKKKKSSFFYIDGKVCGRRAAGRSGPHISLDASLTPLRSGCIISLVKRILNFPNDVLVDFPNPLAPSYCKISKVEVTFEKRDLLEFQQSNKEIRIPR